MKRVAVGAILVVAVAIAAGFGSHAATTGDDDEPRAGTPAGLSKCRADDPNCLARIGGKETPGDPDVQGSGAAGSCLVGTACEDTPETPTQGEITPIEPGAVTTEPSAALGPCAPETPDCVDSADTTTSGGE